MTLNSYRREDPRRVVISDISEQCDESLLYELALQFGIVKRLVWPSEQTISGTPLRKNKCFVDYEHPEDAKYCFQVLSRSPVRLFGKAIKVFHVSQELLMKESSLSNSGNGPTILRGAVRGLHEVGAKIIVRNVNLTATAFEIESCFKRFGEFAAPPRMLRKRSGDFRGDVILSYKDFAFSDRAIREMNEKPFTNRIITVEYAEREDGKGLHGSAEERANAALIQEEERKYEENVAKELAQARKRQRHSDVSWATDNRQYLSNRR